MAAAVAVLDLRMLVVQLVLVLVLVLVVVVAASRVASPRRCHGLEAVTAGLECTTTI